jgi:hypothetical protein
MILDNYDDFNFMVILLFLFFILISFIIMIITNVKSRNKYNQMNPQQTNQYPQTTLSSKYPQISGQQICPPLVTEPYCLF